MRRRDRERDYKKTRESMALPRERDEKGDRKS